MINIKTDIPRPLGSFVTVTDSFINELAEYCGNLRVLEVFSGNGYLASKLIEKGVNIRPTTVLSSHDGHEINLFTEVEEMTASEALAEYGDTSDILIYCWPVTVMDAYKSLMMWDPSKPVIFIGEVPRPELGMMGLSGCATDEFHAAIKMVKSFEHYSRRNMLEDAGIFYIK